MGGSHWSEQNFVCERNSGSWKVENLQIENFVVYFLYLQDFVCKCEKLCDKNIMDLHDY